MSAIASATKPVSPAASAERIFNFSAGPGVLPEAVLRQAQKDLWNIAGSGIGILEHSHRGKVVDKVWEDTINDIREVGSVPANYKVLFLTGGASQQFFQIPMNFLKKGETADYINTGVWSAKAIKEAKAFGDVNVAATSEDRQFRYIPKADQIKWTTGARYAHFTTNNTIYGTEFASEPAHPAGAPLVCDTSSDMFSRPIDVSKYAFIYAGAQKNMGAAGVTVVIARDDFLETGTKDIPGLLQYRTHAAEDSRHNTPPVFAVYLVGQVMKWIKAEGGLRAMGEKNAAKAKPIYDYLDASKLFKAYADKDSRSLMNITFRLPTEEMEAKFIKEATAAGLDGLKGHRSAGGMRASVYNAFPIEGCRALVQFMERFEKANG